MHIHHAQTSKNMDYRTRKLKTEELGLKGALIQKTPYTYFASVYRARSTIKCINLVKCSVKKKKKKKKKKEKKKGKIS